VKRVLITGAAGFLGGYCAREMELAGWNVIGVDGASPENAGLSSGMAYFSVRLPDEGFRRMLEENPPDACVHCAGRASVLDSFKDPSSDFIGSVWLTHWVLEQLRRFAPGCRFVLLSSAAVYGEPEVLPVPESVDCNPMSPYGYHKRCAELLVGEYSTLHGLHGTSLRIFSAFGAGLRRQILWEIGSQFVMTGRIRLQGTGSETRDFIHAADIARAVRLVIERAPGQGEIFNLASGSEVSIGELAREMTRIGGGAFDPEFEGRGRPGDPLHWQAEISRIRELGFEPSVDILRYLPTYLTWVKTLLNTA
jgi:UDP-glucose 4-epimerase